LVDPKFLADLLCDRAGHDDSHRIVRRTHIHKKSKTCNPEFSSLLSADILADQVQYKCDPAHFFYKRHDTRYDDGNDRDIIHPHDTASSVRPLRHYPKQ